MTRADRFPEHLGYFLILPDALFQGLTHDIGRYLAVRGLHPVAATAEVVSEDHRAALYDRGARSKYSASGRVYGRVMTRSLLALDNCLAVLVAGDTATGDVSRLLHDLKGQSSFLRRRPGSLRELSCSADRCMSLIHTPDDAAEAARDAAIFFPTVDVDATRGSRDLDWELVSACRAWDAPSPRQSRYSIAVRTVMRCAALLLAGVERTYSATEYAQLWDIYDVCRNWLAAPVNSSAPGEHQRFLGQCADLEPSAARLVRAAAARNPRDELFAQIILTLVRPSSFSHAEGLQLLEVLDKARLMLSPYEAHHLLTLMTFLND